MGWTSDYPINQLPENISNLFINEAKYLFHDIKNNKLKVVLIPAQKPRFIYHKIRVAVTTTLNGTENCMGNLTILGEIVQKNHYLEFLKI